MSYFSAYFSPQPNWPSPGLFAAERHPTGCWGGATDRSAQRGRGAPGTGGAAGSQPGGVRCPCDGHLGRKLDCCDHQAASSCIQKELERCGYKMIEIWVEGCQTFEKIQVIEVTRGARWLEVDSILLPQGYVKVAVLGRDVVYVKLEDPGPFFRQKKLPFSRLVGSNWTSSFWTFLGSFFAIWIHLVKPIFFAGAARKELGRRSAWSDVWSAVAIASMAPQAWPIFGKATLPEGWANFHQRVLDEEMEEEGAVHKDLNWQKQLAKHLSFSYDFFPLWNHYGTAGSWQEMRQERKAYYAGLRRLSPGWGEKGCERAKRGQSSQIVSTGLFSWDSRQIVAFNPVSCTSPLKKTLAAPFPALQCLFDSWCNYSFAVAQWQDCCVRFAVRVCFQERECDDLLLLPNFFRNGSTLKMTTRCSQKAFTIPHHPTVLRAFHWSVFSRAVHFCFDKNHRTASHLQKFGAAAASALAAAIRWFKLGSDFFFLVCWGEQERKNRIVIWGQKKNVKKPTWGIYLNIMSYCRRMN